MKSALYSLFDEARDEIVRRDASYLTRFPLQLPTEHLRFARYGRHPLLADYPRAALDAEMRAAFQHMSGSTGVAEAPPDAECAVGLVMLDSALDAFAAAEGTLDLRSFAFGGEPLSRTLSERYFTRVAGERQYVVRRTGSRPLLLIAALGVPLKVWSRFLADPEHDFAIITVESRSGGLLEGGMRSAARLDEHAEDIARVLDAEHISKIDVVTWCNGGRIGAALAAKQPERVNSLAFVSTTWRGMSGIAPRPCRFEDSLDQVFRSIRGTPALADILVRMIRNFVPSPEWAAHVDDDAARARALGQLPAAEHSAALLAPMTSGEFLINYGRRTAADEAYPVNDALARIDAAGIPVLLISGEHDNVVSNELAADALRTCRTLVHASVSCAGHYVHDLQYRYFRWLMSSFVNEHRLPTGAARVQGKLQ